MEVENSAVRMTKAGASIVGINCHFDPTISLECIRRMKTGLEAAGLSPFLFVQPLGYCTPDAGKQGFIDLPEFPFALEPRICTRFDIHKFAREAFELGVRYIGGCCGFQPYHIRSVHTSLVHSHFSLVEECRGLILIGRELQSVEIFS